MVANNDVRWDMKSLAVTGKHGRPCGFGLIQFGKSYFGQYDHRAGIYQRRRSEKGTHIYRCKYYTPNTEATPARQALRTKFAQGMAEWQGLTTEQKMFYNNLTYPARAHGVNRFMSMYMRDEV